MQIQRMASAREHEGGAFAARSGEQGAGDGRVLVRGVEAVALAKYEVVLAVDDVDGALERSGRRHDLTEREELAKGEGLLVVVVGVEEVGVVVGVAEEGHLVALRAARHQVAVGQCAEARRLVLVGEGCVEGCKGEAEGGRRQAEAREHDGVDVIGIPRRNANALDGSERVSANGHLAELGSQQIAFAQHLDQRVRNVHLERRLHHLDGIGVVRKSNAQPIVCEGRVACRSRGVDLAVARRKVPVALVEADSVDEELYRRGRDERR